jgi:RecG-like helicase
MGLLHGQMPADEKDSPPWSTFRTGRPEHLLVATSVVEVGVDVPNASVMLVENAERFRPGPVAPAARAHRPGRSHRSYCILQGLPGSREAWQRLKIMERTLRRIRHRRGGFHRMRGMGNLLGREQSGRPGCGRAIRCAIRLLAGAGARRGGLPSDRCGPPSGSAGACANLRHRARALYKSASTFVKVG